MLGDKKEVRLDMLMPVIREKLNMGAKVSLIASGNSMYPLFRHRKDTYTLCKIEGADAKKYDMILYQRDDGQYVLHRIVGVGTDGFVLRGDNQYQNEYPVRAEQIIAGVCSFSRDDRQTDCNSLKYRIYAVLWVNTVTLRRAVRFVKHLPYRVLRKIYRTLKRGGN